jgi:hypothetical protein
MTENDPYADLKQHRATSEMLEKLAVVPRKIQKRREHFIRVPFNWWELLKNAPGQTYRVALYLLYLHWKGRGQPIKLANGMLQIDGISRYSKWRALRELETLGLISLECRPKRSPVVRVVA